MWAEFVDLIDFFFYLVAFIVTSPLLIYFGLKRMRDKKKEKFEDREF